MSLILEALKKSEAERRLGEAPGLSTVPGWAPRRRRSRAWWWLLPALVIAVAAAWSNRDLLDGEAAIAEDDAPPRTAPVLVQDGRDEGQNVRDVPASPPAPQTPDVPSPAIPVAVAPPAVADNRGLPMPEPVPAPPADADALKGLPPDVQRRIRSGELYVPNPSLLLPRPPTPAAEAPIVDAQSALPPPLPEPTEPALETAPIAAASEFGGASQKQNAARDTLAATPAPPPPEPAPAPIAPPPPVPAEAVPASGPPTIHDLTLDQRQGLPALKMSMHVYHRDVTRRFVIIDGNRLGEDGVIGAETWVRQIVPEGVIIEYRNTRFLLPRIGG